MALDDELARIVDEVRAARPGLAGGTERLRERLTEMATRGESLAEIRAADLYLACACLDGDAAALNAFDELLDGIARKLRRADISDDALAEAKQITRHVLVPRGEAAPALADYNGRGSLTSWLRVVLGRELLRVIGGPRRQVSLDSARAAVAADHADDPETAYLKAHYENEFKEAFAAAMAGLEEDDRRALRYAVVERLSIDEIARLERIHRATAARDVARARARLAEKTRAALQERLSVENTQLESILRLVSSQIDVSVRRLLQ